MTTYTITEEPSRSDARKEKKKKRERTFDGGARIAYWNLRVKKEPPPSNSLSNKFRNVPAYFSFFKIDRRAYARTDGRTNRQTVRSGKSFLHGHTCTIPYFNLPRSSFCTLFLLFDSFSEKIDFRFSLKFSFNETTISYSSAALHFYDLRFTQKIYFQERENERPFTIALLL